MKNIGSFLSLIGVLAIVFNFMDRVPNLLMWIYNWGDSVAWAIKISLIVVGVALYYFGKKKEEQQN